MILYTKLGRIRIIAYLRLTIKQQTTLEKVLRVFNIKWNDPTYINEWFEIGPYDDEDDCDVQGEIEQQEDDCNESEDRDDLKIISYEYEFVSE
jgi:hypothetical protein